MSREKILIAFGTTEEVLTEIQKDFDIVSSPGTHMSVEELVDKAQELKPVAIMVSVPHKMTAAVIDVLPDSVKIIATSSVGFDHLDIATAKRRGIALSNTPDVLTDATADLAFLHILGAARRLREQAEIAERGWGKTLGQNEFLGLDLKGKKLGILGMGRIGQAVAQRARGFGMSILYCNRKRLPADLEQGAKYFASFEEMLPHSQFLSLHAPGSSETEKIMNTKSFSLMPKGAVFVNVARGSLVDEDALLAALDSGQLFAAGLDVFENEPNIRPELIKDKRVLLTPHTGSATRETRTAMGLRAFANIKQVLSGKGAQDSLWTS